jgi:hypothetical protein
MKNFGSLNFVWKKVKKWMKVDENLKNCKNKFMNFNDLEIFFKWKKWIDIMENS